MRKNRATKLTCLLIAFLWTTIVVGSSYAYFIDSVTVTGNVVAAGNLKAGLKYKDKTGTWQDASDKTIFDSSIRWEPGYTDVQYVQVSNNGSLAFNYRLNVVPATNMDTTGGANLMDVIDLYCFDGNEVITKQSFSEAAAANNRVGSLSELLAKTSDDTISGKLLAGESKTVCIVLHMQESAGNEYMGLSAGNGFNVQLSATQAMYEQDSFGNTYDQASTWPSLVAPTVLSVSVQPDANGYLRSVVGFNDPENGVSAIVPAGAKVADGVTTLTLKVEKMARSSANVTLATGEEQVSYNVKVEGLAADNTVPAIITMGEVLPTGLNMGNYTLYHVENGVTTAMTLTSTPAAHNDFAYDPATGEVTVAMATFSEVALVADTENAWEGNYDYSWYTNAVAPADDESTAEYTIANADQLAAFGAIVGGMNGQTQDSFSGKTVMLLADVNLGDKDNANESLIFYPIGYYNSTGSYEKTSGGSVTSSVSSFEGIFDGNGHTISNFHQNTWEMFGDYNDGYSGTPNHYKDAMGLFGYVKGGTVKNLTVDSFSSDGEFTPTGVIAAFADGGANFENIAITNCNPRVYNTGNGGIIGIAGDTSTADDDHITLKNITVDNSNKISALWGSWDVACGGLVGMYRGNVDGSGKETGDTISFTNCHVSAQIDVYNDVCANYQYYAYRYAGMIIGSVRHNTTNDDNKTIPDMTGISATGCTVNYGDWNDYYYCEFEKNTIASYSEDYQFSRVDKSEITFDENGNVTGCTHTHTDAEDKRAVYLPFHQLFTGYSWGVSSVGLEKYSGIVTNLDITEGDQQESVEKFETKFTSDFRYRVGNAKNSPVSLGSLFKANAGMTISNSGVWVSVEPVDEDMNVSGTFTSDTDDWTQGTIQFSGTGVVKVTIQDYNFCTPTVLYLEVVDAVNATSATSATTNNVVLLNDCGFSSLEVSGGYALYGNGFTMTCGSDSAALDMGYSFVTLNNGTLDNVQIVCPNFDYAVLYKSNMTESGNRSETTDKTRYFNVKSGVMVSGNSQILNSRISGARAAVNVSGGNCVIDNSRVELGAVASILVGAANSVTLHDVTLVQKPTASTYDSSKTLMGFSVLVMCTSGGDAAPITLEGTLVQNAWVDENDKQYVPEDAQTIIDTVMGKEEYLHDIDGDGTNESLNLGIAYMPADGEYTVNTPSITDNRTNKDTVPYDSVEVKYSLMTTYVYSYKNTNGTDDSIKTEGTYTPDTQGDIITVAYSDSADGLTTGKSYGTDGWVYELNVDLDKLSGYALDFSKLSMSVNGVTVTDFKVNGSDKPTSPVAVTAGGTTYTLTATVDDKECTAYLKVTGTETSKESPSLVASDYEAGLCVASSYGGTWHGAAPVLEGVQIKYWSVAEQQYKTITLSNYTPTTAGQQNGTNSYWTYTPDNGDFTLTIKNETPVHSGNSVYAMPVVVNVSSTESADNKLYFVASSSNGLVNSGNSARTIAITYYFNDNNNGDQLKFSNTWSVEENKDDQYKYSDFCSGTKTKLENYCITPDTLVTLADGSKKEIQHVTYEDELLVWDFYKGCYTTATACTIVDHGESTNTVITLIFEDGTVVKVVNCHAFMDATENEFVYVTADNIKNYIGHNFVKHTTNEYSTVTLVDYKVVDEVSGSYTLVSNEHYNFITENIFSATLRPEDIGAFQYFDIGDNMTYANVAEDIAKYGVFTYDEFADRISRAAFDGFNVQYMKIAIGKGLVTEEAFQHLIDTMVIYTK